MSGRLDHFYRYRDYVSIVDPCIDHRNRGDAMRRDIKNDIVE